MNGQHFRAFLWLRWRLLINQLRRGGTTNAVIQAALLLFVAAFAVAAAVAFFVVGLVVLPAAAPSNLPSVLMYVWDGIVVAFLFCWTLGLLVELQRSEVLSLEKFLHLPVSLKSAFLINYFSSLFSVTLAVFVPSMLALSIALVFSQGPALLLLLPLVAAFVLLVTALTYQLQGWLAALMVNKRRGRTVIALVTMAFILVCQVPNLINVLRPWERQQQNSAATRMAQEQQELQDAIRTGKIAPDQVMQRDADIRREYQTRVQEAEQQTLAQVDHITQLVNLCFPPGWLPLGAAAAAEGHVLPAVLGILGFTFLGTVSLWRSYRTTVRLYTGQFTSGKRQPVAVKKLVKSSQPLANLLEKQLPWLSEPAAAVALGSFRSLLRAPEAKMLLLTPAILAIVFGSMLLGRSSQPPEMVRPLMAFGAMSMTLMSLVQIVGNPFGFDRGGFRVYVLSGASRRDILLGKNLSVAPLAFGLSAVLVTLLQLLSPMRLEHYLATLPQFVSMYLLFCLLANWMALFAPMPIRSGSFKPANPRGLALLFQLLLMFLFPCVLAPTLLPLGVEVALEWLGMSHGVPLCLLLTVVECAAVVFVYRLVLAWQGKVLQSREQKILEIVTTRTE